MSPLKMYMVQIDDRQELIAIDRGIVHKKITPKLTLRIAEMNAEGVLLLIRYWYDWNLCNFYEVIFSGGAARIVPCPLHKEKFGIKQVFARKGNKHIKGTQIYCRYCNTECFRVRGDHVEQLERGLVHPETGALLKYSGLEDVNANLIKKWFDIDERREDGRIHYGYDCRLVIMKKDTQGRILPLRIGTRERTFIIGVEQDEIKVGMLPHDISKFMFEMSEPYDAPPYDERTGESL